MDAASSTRRTELLLAILREEALPAEILLNRLNRQLTARKLEPISIRTLQHELTWIEEHVPGSLEKVTRTQLETPPPEALAWHRWFYRLRGSEDVIMVPKDLVAITEMQALALATARAVLTAPQEPHSTGVQDEGPLAAALGSLMASLGINNPGRIPDIIAVNQGMAQRYNPAHAITALRAIRVRHALAMDYESVGKGRHLVTVAPLRLAINDGEIYLWAWDPQVEKAKPYKLSRIHQASIAKQRIRVPAGTDADVKARIRGSFRGYSSEKERCRVTIRFAKSVVPFVQNRLLGGSQESKGLSDGGLRVSFNTSAKSAIQRWLLQFGADAEVESPQDLRDWLKEEAVRLVVLYGR